MERQRNGAGASEDKLGHRMTRDASDRLGDDRSLGLVLTLGEPSLGESKLGKA